MPPFARSLDELYPEALPIDQLPDLTPPESVVPPDMAPYRPDLASGPHTAFPIEAPGVMRGDQPPMLTNIPQTAEAATKQGADVYFLSDTPQTEQFLKTGEAKPYKYVLHDVPPPKPSESQMSLTDAWKDFASNEFPKQFGFDPNKVNPGEMGQKAYDKYIQDNIGHLAPQQVGLLDPKYLKSIYSMADKQRTEGNRIGVGMLRQADQIRQLFARDFLQKRAIANRPKARDRMIPVQDPTTGKTILMPESQTAMMKPGAPAKETPIEAKNPDTGKTTWYFPQSQTWGPEVGAKPSSKEPSFKEEKLKEMWTGLDDQSKLKVLGALPADKDLTEKNILDVYGNIFTDAATKTALQPIVNEITKRAAEKNKNPAGGQTRILPPGSNQIGTLNGKAVYQTPDGKRVVMQ